MAKLTVGAGWSFDFQDFNASVLLEGYSYTGTARRYVIDYPYGETDTLLGTGFSYRSATDPTPVSGTVYRYTRSYDGKLVYDFQHLSLSAVDLVKIAKTVSVSDDFALLKKQLGADDTMIGADDMDVLNGYAGNDTLLGKGWDDVLRGGSGDDVLVGGLGRDMLIGGQGSDVFQYRGNSESVVDSYSRDTIRDFEAGVDRIDLALIDADRTHFGNSAFQMLRAEGREFTGKSGELRWYQSDKPGSSTDSTLIQADTNGDGGAEIEIRLSGLIDLKPSDFIL